MPQRTHRLVAPAGPSLPGHKAGSPCSRQPPLGHLPPPLGHLPPHLLVHAAALVADPAHLDLKRLAVLLMHLVQAVRRQVGRQAGGEGE
jgi:hypothetical protein